MDWVGFQFTEAFHRWSVGGVSLQLSMPMVWYMAAYLRCSPAATISHGHRQKEWSTETEDALKRPTMASRVGDESRCAMPHDKESGQQTLSTYLGSKDGGSSTHKRGSISRLRSEEGGYEEPLETLLN